MKFKDFINEIKTFADIEKAIIKDIKKNRKKIVKESFGSFISITDKSQPIDLNLLYLLGIFQKHFGKIGTIFEVGFSDDLTIPTGQYKILKYIRKNKDIMIELEDVKKKKSIIQKIFKRTLKVPMKQFLRKAGL